MIPALLGMQPPIIQQPTDIPIVDSLNAKAIVRDILFMSDFQRKNMNHLLSKLIDLSIFDMSKVELKEYPDFNDNFAFVVGNRVSNPIPFNTVSETIETFNKFNNLITKLSYKGYVLAGGSVLQAITNTSSISNYSYIQRPGDYDFFFITGSTKSNLEKEVKANELYQSFINEIYSIYISDLKDKCTIRFIRNKNCTTVFIRHRNNKNRNYELSLKLQLIHRAYESKEEVLLGFDLPNSQFLFDGNTIKGTYSGLMAKYYNILPIDVKRCSTSLVSRVKKYNHQKQISIIFPGMDSFPKNPPGVDSTNVRIYNFVIELVTCPNGPDYQSLTSMRPEDERISSNYELGFSNVEERIDGSYNRVMLDDIESVDRSFGRLNINQHILDREIYYYGLTPNQFIKNPLRTDVQDAFRYLAVVVLKKGVMNRIKRLFGNLFISAMECISKLNNGRTLTEKYVETLIKIIFKDGNILESFSETDLYDESQVNNFDPNFRQYAMIINQRSNEIHEEMNSLWDEFEDMKWRLTDPGTQDYGSFNSVDMNARKFYDVPNGLEYTGFHCTYMWEQKMTIIRAWMNPSQEPDFAFSYLPKQLLKLIFNHLDSYRANEILNDVYAIFLGLE